MIDDIEASGDNVGGSFFVLSEQMFLPDSSRILWLFPPHKPLPVGEAIRTLGGTGDVATSIIIDVAETHVMRSADNVLIIAHI